MRERGIDEISEMIDYFIKKKQRDMHSPGILRFEKEAWDKLLHYAFPGNVREMENIIESLYVFAEEEITLNDLPKRIQINSGKSYVHSEVEREHILKVTKLFGNQKKKTALALGISYNTYKKKIESFQKIANSANS